VPLRVSTITPTALNTYFFRARAGRNKTRPSDNDAASGGSAADAAAAGKQDGSSTSPPGEAAAEGTGDHGSQQPAGSLLHATDVVQAVFWCLSAPEHVDVSDVSIRSLLA
jgi:hypothetical protein